METYVMDDDAVGRQFADAIELASWERRSPALHVEEWFGRLWEYWL
jgi:hypothetical protein